MNTKKLTLLSASIIYSLSANASDFGMDQVDISKIKMDRWKCEYCIKPEAISGEWSVGGYYLSNDEDHAFRNIRDFDNTAGIDASFDFTYRIEDGGYAQVWFTGLDGEPFEPGLNLGASLEYFSGAELDINYTENTRYYGNSPQTPYLNKGSSNVNLPDSWTFANNTQDMNVSDELLNDFNYELKREVLDMAFEYHNDTAWLPSISYSHEKKEGLEPKSGVVEYHAAFLPNPISYTTDTIKTNLSYQSAKLFVDVGYHYADFDNDKEQLSWQSPYLIVNGDVYSQTPDSEYQRVSINTRYNMERTQLAAKASFSRTEQDQDYVNDLNVNSLNSLDGKIDTTQIVAKATHRYSSDTRFSAKVDFLERNNKTDKQTVDGRTNRVNDHRKTKVNLTGQYKGYKPVNLKFGFQTLERKQPQSERERVTDNKVWMSVADRTLSIADISLNYSYSEREGSKYREIDNSKNEQNKLLRRYNLADKRQNKVRGNFSIALEDYLSTDVNLYYKSQQYHNTQVGLTKSHEKGADFALIGNYKSFDWQFFFAYQKNKYQRSGANNSATSIYDGINENQTKQIGFNAESSATEESPYSIGFNYNYTEGKVNESIDINRESNALGFPESKYEEHRADIYVDYMLSEKSSIKAQLIYERNDDVDYFYQNADMDTLTNVLTSGILGNNYQSIFFQLSYSKKL